MLKLLNYLWGIGLLATLMSCSSSNESKEISPTSTEFASGELAKLIEVVDEPCQLSYAEKDGVIPSQFIKLKVKLRLKKESPELQKVDAHDIDFTGLLSIATINLVDENETKVQDLDVKSEDVLKLKKLLQGEKGSEEIITFENEFHNSKDAPTWFKETSAFTPYLTGDAIVGDGVIISISSSSDSEGSHDLTGVIDEYPVTMHLEIDGTQIKGSYYYDKQGPNAKLTLTGTNNDGVWDINETDADGTPTGHFKGNYIDMDGIYSGSFVTNKGKKMSFELMSTRKMAELQANEELDEPSISDYDDTDLTISDEGDSSYDAFLDEYEKFWRTYMNFAKKMDQNNPSAMIEYAKLLKQYQSYSEKLERIKGNLSMSQLNRINKMNIELMQEINKIQQ